MEPVISQPPITSVPVPPTPKKPNSLVWILLFLVLLLSATVVFFAYQNFQLRQQLTAQLSSTPSPSPAGTLVKEGDPTASWKIYSSNDLGISFKYPSDLIISLNNFQSSTFLSVIDTEKKIIGEGSAVVSPIEFSFDLNGNNLENAISQARESYTTESLKILKLNLENGVDITILSGIHSEGWRGGERTKQAYLVNKEGKTIVVNYYGYLLQRENEINEKVFDQILSTFKFIE